MTTTLSEQDIEAIARRIVALIGAQLALPPTPHTPSGMAEGAAGLVRQVAPKLAYTAMELCEELSISRDTVYKLEASGRLRSMPGIRHKRYTRDSVERLLNGDNADWKRR